MYLFHVFNEIISFIQDGNFGTSLELAVRFGKTLIIQEMDSIEPVLYPLLRADLISQGTNILVPLAIQWKFLSQQSCFKLCILPTLYSECQRHVQLKVRQSLFGIKCCNFSKRNPQLHMQWKNWLMTDVTAKCMYIHIFAQVNIWSISVHVFFLNWLSHIFWYGKLHLSQTSPGANNSPYNWDPYFWNMPRWTWKNLFSGHTVSNSISNTFSW